MSEVPEYPLAEKQPQELKSPSGLPFSEITLEAVLQGRVGMNELRTSSEALMRQAEIARAAGRRQLAENLERAAELTRIPEEEILGIYEALRPGRASPAELEQLAVRLERDYQALRTAALVREAARFAGESASRNKLSQTLPAISQSSSARR